MFWGFYDTIFYDYQSICSYFHMSFCTKRWKPLQLNISLPNHVLHKKRCSTDKYCFGKQPCRAQHSSAVVRAGGIHTRSQGSGLTQEELTLSTITTRHIWSELSFFGVVQVRGQEPTCPSPNTTWEECTQLCRPGDEPLPLQQVQHLLLPTTTFNTCSGRVFFTGHHEQHDFM